MKTKLTFSIKDRFVARFFATTMVLFGLAAPAGHFVSAGSAQNTVSFPYVRASEPPPAGYRSVARKLSQSYVMVTMVARGDPVTGEGRGDMHTGSGVVVSQRGHVLTAAHIARNRKLGVRLTLPSGKTVSARVLAVDPRQEVALIKGPPLRGLAPLPIRTKAPPKGTWLVGIGSPRKRWGVATLGRVRMSDIGERLQYGAWGFDHAIEVGMEVQSGHSGGPVADMQGRLIGMIASYELGDTTKSVYVSPRIAYVVPAKTIVDFLSKNGVR